MLHSIRPSNGSATGKLRRRVRGAAIVSLLGSLGLLLAACSSGSANAAGSGTTSTTSGGSASFTAYENCLKSHGVTFSPGDFRPGGGPPSSGSPSGSTTRTTLSPSERTKFEQASTACASLRPKFNGGGTGASTAFAAYRNCLKLHGVTLPTGRGAGGFGFGGSSTSTTSNPKLEAALAACAALRPKGGFGGGFPGGTTTTTS
ncbi:MAG: hypothetical protein ACLP6E_14650 [Acidimicrobiales bacterium]